MKTTDHVTALPISSSESEDTSPGVPSFTIIGAGVPVLHIPAEPLDVGGAAEFDSDIPTREFHRAPSVTDDAVVVDVDPMIRHDGSALGLVGLRVSYCKGVRR